MSAVIAVIRGEPGPAKINGRFTIAHGRLIKSNEYRKWCREAAATLAMFAKLSRFPVGPVRVTVDAYWPRRHQQGPAIGLAFGDVDAIGKAVCDSIEVAGIVASDAQVTECILRKHVAERPTQARVEIKIEQVTP